MASHKFRWALAPILVLSATVACAAEASSEADSGADSAAAGQEVLARVGAAEITMADIEDQIRGQLAELDRQRHQLIERALAGRVDQALLEAEAEARGVSMGELVSTEINSKVPAITDAEVDAYYEGRKQQINRPKEEVVDQIRNALTSQKSRGIRSDFLRSLRDKHEVESLFGPMRVEVAEADAPSFGPEDAPVTLIEFSDFQCPYCSRLVPTIEKVKEEYGDKVRIEFRQFPLERIHPAARVAAEASLCADEEGKFWELHDAMFADFRNLSRDRIVEMGGEVGLGDAFVACVDEERHSERVSADLQAGRAAGVSGTPAMFINGRFISGAVPFDRVAAVIDEELAESAG